MQGAASEGGRSSSPRRRLLILLGIVASGVFLWLSVRTIELAELGNSLSRVRPEVLLLSPLVTLASFALGAARSSVLMRPVARLSGFRLFKSVILAYAVNNVIPFRAGEIARIGYLARYGNVPTSSCLAVVAVERMTDVLASMAIVLAAVPAIAVALPIGSSVYLIAAVVAVFVLCALIISRQPRMFVRVCAGAAGVFGTTMRDFISAKASSFADGLVALRSPRVFITVLAITSLFWLLALVTLEVWFLAFGFELPWFGSIVLLAFLSFGLAIPSTPGNIGTYHFFTVSALTFLGIGQADALAFAIVGHAITSVPFTLLAIPLLMSDLRSKPSPSIQLPSD